MSAPLPPGEAARLDALRGYGILDTPPEAAFERIARLASRMLGMPIAAVSFVDKDRQWFKARVGLNIWETTREVSFCAHAIHEDKIMVVPDAKADPRFADNGLVTGEPGIRFYAGAPLQTRDGHPLGTLCVLDRRPRRFSKNQCQILADLAALVLDELTLRLEISTRQQADARLRDQHRSLQTLHESVEKRVIERTAELTRANHTLRSEMRQRELADRERAQSEERFQLAILHSPLPIMLHNSDGEIVQVNHAWTHMTGYRDDHLRTMEDWITRAYPTEQARQGMRDHVANLTNHIGASERPGQEICCVDRSVRVWDFTCANLDRLPDGRWLHITTAVDVTERLQSEADLRAAKEEAERANRAKSGFLSRMSHELRTPLNAILGFGQLLEYSPLGTEETVSLSYIMQGARHLLELIDEVLDLSRAETGELHLAREAVDVRALAQECVGLVARLAQARGITCRVSIPRRTSLWVDKHRLRQMLLNLLSNAIKYNREDGEVLVRSEVTSRGRLRLNVSDTGPGIPPEGLARLFVPFERLEQEFTEAEGTGLGLVISRRIAEAMGGNVDLESEVGRGSKFWIELPLTKPPKGGADARSGRVPPATPQVVQQARLLYVEDNPSNLQVVKALLANCRPRWEFLSARDGVEGLRRACEDAPDLILLDLQLPGMKGDEVLAKLRRDARTRLIPVILLSADATLHSRERLLTNGADEYVSKPFKLDNLLGLLDRALAKAGRKSPPDPVRGERQITRSTPQP